MTSEDQRVVVTGLGAVTAYGMGVEAFFEGLLSGRSTGRRIERFDPSAFAVQIACEIPDFAPFDHLPRKLVRQLDPFAQFGMVAAAEALADAGLLAGDNDPTALHLPLGDVDPTRVSALVASGVGGLTEVTEQQDRLREGGPGKVRPYLAIALPPNMGGGQVAIRHGIKGACYTVASACASGTDAIGNGLDLIRAGRADVVLAGGAEAPITPIEIAGFGNAGALSRNNDDPSGASRPFDVARDGFVTGEGAGLIVLERASHAEARGARVLAELAGYGASNDAHHPTQPSKGGEGAVRALRLALRDADVAAQDIDHVNAHGTSTQANDAAEAQAVRTVLGAHTDEVAVTSTKSAIGHLLGAAGGVEAVATLRAMRDELVPPSLNLSEQDPACPVDVVSGEPRKVRVRAALSNSFGFGGHNAVLVFRQC